MKVGVFDSGVGGLSVARAIEMALPNHEVIFKNDVEHVPYGDRDIGEILGFVQPILQELIAQGCEVIVIACNTVTTNLMEELRRVTKVPLVGMEPMIKPAAEKSKSKIIAVCATPRTLSSKRYAWLKEEYAKGVRVIEPDCSDWSYLIETNSLDREKIAKIINDVCNAGADEIVLGCTHYHWIEDQIKQLVNGRAEVLQPEQPVIKQLKRVLERLA